jgi:hypothetical protein
MQSLCQSQLRQLRPDIRIRNAHNNRTFKTLLINLPPMDKSPGGLLQPMQKQNKSLGRCPDIHSSCPEYLKYGQAESTEVVKNGKYRYSISVMIGGY